MGKGGKGQVSLCKHGATSSVSFPFSGIFFKRSAYDYAYECIYDIMCMCLHMYMFFKYIYFIVNAAGPLAFPSRILFLHITSAFSLLFVSTLMKPHSHSSCASSPLLRPLCHCHSLTRIFNFSFKIVT